MKLLTLRATSIGAWIMAIIYDWMRVNMGVEIEMILGLALVMLAFGLYTGCQENKETMKEET